MRIATGHDLSENVLDTVFKLFDMDGDNCLSHKEFMGVMTDRVLRGLKVSQSILIFLYHILIAATKKKLHLEGII